MAETLQALERAQLVRRSVTPDPGPHPLYALLPAGSKLLSRLRRLLDEVQEGD